MARASNTDERRAEIVDALLVVMAERGYDGASVARVAAQAGLAPGLVHYHFANKREILLQAVDTLAARHAERVQAALEAAGTERPPRRGHGGCAGHVPGVSALGLALWLDLHLGLGAHADPQALACWVLIGGEALRDPLVQERFVASLERVRAGLAALLEQGRAAGDFRDLDVPAASAALVALVQGYFVLGASARDLVPPGSALRAARAMAQGLVGAPLPVVGGGGGAA